MPPAQTGATHLKAVLIEGNEPGAGNRPLDRLTKIDLIRYYSLVAPLMLEHLKGRPVSLVRAPEGISGELFFQKHWEKENMQGVRPA